VIANLFRPTHLLLVLAIAFLVFGPKNLPQIGRSLGEAIRGFKGTITDGEQDVASKPPASAQRKT
jgi:TatA/E family protein of Tat protein translocase